MLEWIIAGFGFYIGFNVAKSINKNLVNILLKNKKVKDFITVYWNDEKNKTRKKNIQIGFHYQNNKKEES